MSAKRGRGRPKKVIPGQEWLREPPPEYLREGLTGRLREQADDIARMEVARKALIKQYGGFGIPDDLAYQLNDIQDPEVPDNYRQKILRAISQATERVREGNRAGADTTRRQAQPVRDGVLERQSKMIALRRSRGHSELSIAKRLAELEQVSVRTAQRWLKSFRTGLTD